MQAMSHNATTLTSWMRCLKAALESRGIPSTPLFERAGLDPAGMQDPNARYPQAAITRLWQLAIEASNDPALGLDVGRQVNQTTFHALGYSLLASQTLEECFTRLLRYFRIVSDAAELDFCQVDSQTQKFVIHPLAGDAQPSDAALDALLSVLIRLCRALAGPQFTAAAIYLHRPPPVDKQLYEKVFKAALFFDATESAIHFHTADLQRALPYANPELARHNDEILSRYLAHFDKENTANRVHAVLVELLSQGEPSQEKVADALHMSLRNLQRKLSDEDSSYKTILNNTRRDLALSYIKDQRYSISEITFLLGFADSSSFTRAFKRWTGQAPSAFRNNLSI